MSFTEEEFVFIKRFVERRGRDAAHVTVAPVDTAQYCSPRSPSSETSFDARVCIERNEESRMDPEQDQLESPSASTGLETPGQQCHPNWETGRTAAAGCLPAGVGSNLEGNSSPTERDIGTRAGSVATTPVDSSKTASLQTSRKPKANEENKQFDPGGKGGEPSPWKAGVLVIYSFSGGNLGHGGARCSCFVVFSVRVCLLCTYLSGYHFSAS